MYVGTIGGRWRRDGGDRVMDGALDMDTGTGRYIEYIE